MITSSSLPHHFAGSGAMSMLNFGGAFLSMGILATATPPKLSPPINKALLRVY